MFRDNLFDTSGLLPLLLSTPCIIIIYFLGGLPCLEDDKKRHEILRLGQVEAPRL